MKQIYYWLIFIIGLLIMSFGISLMIVANLGSAPWDVFHIGLNKKFGLTIGTWSIIVGFLIVGITAVLSKTLPTIGTFVNMVLVGIFIDWFLALPWMQTPKAFIGQFVMLVLGILINGFGISLYISANRGAGPRDTLMLYLTSKTNWSIAAIRRTMEVFVLMLGWGLGGPVWIGTVLFGLTIGSIVGYTLPICQQYMTKFIERGVNIENINQGTIRLDHHDGAR